MTSATEMIPAERNVVLEGFGTRVLGAREERELLRSLAECRQELSTLVLAAADSAETPPASTTSVSARLSSSASVGSERWARVYRRYNEIRSRLALANVRLVSHFAKRYAARGVSVADLFQEGFCGLLEAIDRFDLEHETRLSTYATWSIRQSMQRAIASGAYPVRLSPRHLRQLARNQHMVSRPAQSSAASVQTAALTGSSAVSSERIHRIFTATRPAASLDARRNQGSRFNLLEAIADLPGDPDSDIDSHETVTQLMQTLPPREQEILSLRFGLAGKPELTLSQVGAILKVSKERVRQIETRALKKLQAAAGIAKVEALSA
jgi:RNA polymerase primary sigma factor